VPPRIQPFSFGEYALNQGHAAMVPCQVVEGDAPIRIHWKYQGRPISAESRVSVMSINGNSIILSIHAVQADHAGEYACVAQNDAGQHEHAAQLAVIGREFALELFIMPLSKLAVVWSIRMPHCEFLRQ
jgi:Immunoglobulin I-set domain